ncbi:MAG: hydroxyacylglutathione hydrolase [Rhodobacter sp.]|nr:hydroxyacylglutathione hydrolase [Rhodobacter sp.]
MPLEIVTVPCLADNYAFLIHSSDTGKTALVDAPEAAAISAELARRGWSLSHILITHHHGDHIDGVETLRAASGARVVGAAADARRLPRLDLTVAEGDRFAFAGHEVQVFDVSGHTIGHIAYYIADANAVFTADSLMALGCGRLFEGSAEQMWASLSKLAVLPPETMVCSGHEYTAANAKFALTVEPGNAALIARAKSIAAARASGTPTVPSTLAEELATNPFLRAHLSEVKAAIGMQGAGDAECFAEIRARKDRF